MRVLIVDDNEIDLELLHATLTRAGYEVDVARNGKQALETVRHGAHRLVISDWEMPEMSGVELSRRIRAHGFTHYIYIILVTAQTRPLTWSRPWMPERMISSPSPSTPRSFASAFGPGNGSSPRTAAT